MKKKQLALYFMSFTILAMSICGCNVSRESKKSLDTLSEVTASPTVQPSPEEGSLLQDFPDLGDEENNSDSSKEFSFTDISNLYFIYSSGVGAWSTDLYINENGSFFGNYHDSEMGEQGEDYPNGICYYCDFEGMLEKPEKVNEYTYSMRIKSIKLDKQEGTEEIKDCIRYIYTKPYGLEGAKCMLVFLPGSPIKELLENFINWTIQENEPREDKLTYYGLYNREGGDGFRGFKRSKSDSIEEELKKVQKEADLIKDKLENKAVTQLEMNELSYQLYQIWDTQLNAMWKKIKLKLKPDEMSALRVEERKWIEYKEKEIKKAGEGSKGDSIQPLLENVRAAQLTKDRVYQLAFYLK